MDPALSIIIPANNEAAHIADCLEAILASRWSAPAPVQTIVVANGCTDDTADRARDFAARFTARGWLLDVIDLQAGGKPGALNAGDAAALGPMRAYLDADVKIEPVLLEELARTLDVGKPRYASGHVDIAATGWVSRAYARIWRQVPFMRHGVPGCGLFAVNAAGRDRWGAFPQIIADDIFVRLSFAPNERIGVPSSYRWPIAEGFRALVRVRRRQDAGVAEIADRYPDRLPNEDKPDFPRRQMLPMALRDPVGFVVYAGVSLAVRLTPGRRQGWSRGR